MTKTLAQQEFDIVESTVAELSSVLSPAHRLLLGWLLEGLDLSGEDAPETLQNVTAEVESKAAEKALTDLAAILKVDSRDWDSVTEKAICLMSDRSFFFHKYEQSKAEANRLANNLSDAQAKLATATTHAVRTGLIERAIEEVSKVVADPASPMNDVVADILDAFAFRGNVADILRSHGALEKDQFVTSEDVEGLVKDLKSQIEELRARKPRFKRQSESAAFDTLDRIAEMVGLDPEEADCPTLLALIENLVQVDRNLREESRPVAEAVIAEFREIQEEAKDDQQDGWPYYQAEEPGQRATGTDAPAGSPEPEAPADPAPRTVVALDAEPPRARSGQEEGREPALKPWHGICTPQQAQMAIGLYARHETGGISAIEVAAKVDGLTKDAAFEIARRHQADIRSSREMYNGGDELALGRHLVSLLRKFEKRTQIAPEMAVAA